MQPSLGLLMQVQARDVLCEEGCQCTMTGRKRSVAVAIRRALDGREWLKRCEFGTRYCEDASETFEVRRIPALVKAVA